jgi:two-component system LytT family response regulator
MLDDEPGNLRLLKNILQQSCPQVKLIAESTDAREGIRLIRELEPQLVFLDIEMPHINGFETLKQLEPVMFEVIFVTAYSHYAVEAFGANATGFVTKPVNAEKLSAAVNIAVQRIEQKTMNRNIFSFLESAGRQEVQKIPLSTSNGLVFVKISDIMYCESSGNYTQFFLHDQKPILVSRQLGEYEKLLPEAGFMRIHDKYIINLSFIKEYIKGSGGDVVLDNGKELPVASRRKEDFLARFEKWIKRSR